ncbi:hypothetical protein GGX14DRAFT_390457 [Mycena pura]|uniref:Uncharacterized protein n=1 Tax=Mycena pura TaxID=153505 RepID=A0AAD6YFN0_9AGAR|nr:hypothetical protein GGX14DRAFT_390457 [Mycena pura]
MTADESREDIIIFNGLKRECRSIVTEDGFGNLGGQSRTLVSLWTVSDWVASFFEASVTVDGCESVKGFIFSYGGKIDGTSHSGILHACHEHMLRPCCGLVIIMSGLGQDSG